MKRPFPSFGMALNSCTHWGKWPTRSARRDLHARSEWTTFSLPCFYLAACVALLSPSSFILPPLQGAGSKEVPMRATALRCEYLVNPLGIDEKRPRLSWVIESEQRGQKQTAYQV